MQTAAALVLGVATAVWISLYGEWWAHQEAAAPDDEVTVRSYLRPLLTDSLEKDMADATISLSGLLEWRRPHAASLKMATAELLRLVPARGLHVGDTWYMVEPFVDYGAEQTDDGADGASSTLSRLLSMLHHNVFLQTRSLPRGTLAVLRAYNEELLDVVFRCHAEYQLNRPPLLPLWFTPAQFRGRLVVRRDRSQVLHLVLSVPADRKVNVDLEWLNTVDDYMEVDIGFVPVMKVEMEGDALRWDEIVWDDHMSVDEAEALLEKEMFPFKQVTYHPLPEAVHMSSLRHMPLHVVVLWGALDDMSC